MKHRRAARKRWKNTGGPGSSVSICGEFRGDMKAVGSSRVMKTREHPRKRAASRTAKRGRRDACAPRDFSEERRWKA